MPYDEDDIKAADVLSDEQVEALLKIYGYQPVLLGRIEDVKADRIIIKGLEEGKKLEDIVKESGKSLSTVKRRRNEWLGLKKKNPGK